MRVYRVYYSGKGFMDVKASSADEAEDIVVDKLGYISEYEFDDFTSDTEVMDDEKD